MRSELTFDGKVAPGAKGARARRAQEWLCLHGHNTAVDAHFGPASAAATRAFQRRHGLPERGIVDEATFERLVAPMAAVLAPQVPPIRATLGAMVASFAEQHLAQHPREVGGQNMGPWVRLYMDGNQGDAWPWCAGFVTFVLRQAAASLSTPMPVKRTFSCDVLAQNATRAACFYAGAQPDVARRLTPGSFFLNRRVKNDWNHVGIITTAAAESFETIEGNTNDSGHREGFEVCKRTRGYAKKDFVLIA